MEHLGKTVMRLVEDVGRVLIVQLFFLPVLLLCLCSQSVLAAGDPKPGTILARELNMRSGPGRHGGRGGYRPPHGRGLW